VRHTRKCGAAGKVCSTSMPTRYASTSMPTRYASTSPMPSRHVCQIRQTWHHYLHHLSQSTGSMDLPAVPLGHACPRLCQHLCCPGLVCPTHPIRPVEVRVSGVEGLETPLAAIRLHPHLLVAFNPAPSGRAARAHTVTLALIGSWCIEWLIGSWCIEWLRLVRRPPAWRRGPVWWQTRHVWWSGLGKAVDANNSTAVDVGNSMREDMRVVHLGNK